VNDVDRVIHEPARLRILTALSGVDVADFQFLLSLIGLTKGNLASHMDKLERSGYVRVDKSFRGKFPHTDYRLTPEGRKALQDYWRTVDEIRDLSGASPDPRV